MSCNYLIGNKNANLQNNLLHSSSLFPLHHKPFSKKSMTWTNGNISVSFFVIWLENFHIFFVLCKNRIDCVKSICLMSLSNSNVRHRHNRNKRQKMKESSEQSSLSVWPHTSSISALYGPIWACEDIFW